MTRTRRRHKKLVALGLMTGSLAAAGYLAGGAMAGPCVGGVATTHCDDPTKTVDAVTALAGENIGSLVVQADRGWRQVRKTAQTAGLPDPGTVGVPTVGGVLPPIGPIGPGPVGDGLKTAKKVVGRGFDTYQDAVDMLPNGGDVGVPTVGGVLPPIGPIGPGPVGDELKKRIDPILDGKATDVAAVKARVG
jgi:hypothetical protein